MIENQKCLIENQQCLVENQHCSIKFNTYKFGTTRGGDKCNVVTDLNLIKGSNNKDKNAPLIQTYGCGYRVDSTHTGEWNGTIFCDLDIKKFKHNGDYFFGNPLGNDKYEANTKFELFYKRFISTLEIKYANVFYASQISQSGVGFHIILYFNCERTEDNFERAKEASRTICFDVATSLGKDVETVLNYPDVFDTCTNSIGQGIYISEYPIRYNGYPTEFTGIFDLENIELELDEFTETDVKFISNKTVKNIKFVNELPSYSYNECTFKLMWIVFNYYEFDYTKCKEAWRPVLNSILENRTDKTERKLWAEFDSAYTNSKGKHYGFNQKLLKWAKDNLKISFIISKKFEPKQIEMYKPDVVFELGENDKLSDLKDKIQWDRNRINHIYAGCGLGKTFNAKELGKKMDIDDIDWLLGERNKRVLFISPMRSINKDSFNDVDDWEIIDSDHNENNKDKYGQLVRLLQGDKNICTTWESYVLYKMYNYNFDYVIVDEIHTLYMYDYRLKSIYNLKRFLPLASGIKIIMSGTPSIETTEFDCYKIQVNKKLKEVNCDLVFYNENFRGYYMQDIVEWTKEPNHYVLLFQDKANYKTEEVFNLNGLDCDVFNSNYIENVNNILTIHDVRKQITIFSVYGQAGINLECKTNEDKKFRIYIICNNALGIIQYANRMRNRDLIDKIVIGYKTENISNRVNAVSSVVNYDFYAKRVEQLNLSQNKFDLFNEVNKRIIKLNYGLIYDILDRIDGNYILNETMCKEYAIIKNVLTYEQQLQVIWNRLVNNYFNVSFVYLENDVKDLKNTLRANTFGGKMAVFDCTQIKVNNSNEIWLDVTDDFRKVCTGNIIEVIENTLNILYKQTNNLDDTIKEFVTYINESIKINKTITKKDLEDFERYVAISTYWNKYEDNVLVKLLLSNNWSVAQLTAAFVRHIYKEGLDLKMTIDECYIKMKSLKVVANKFKYKLLELNECNPFEISNDELMTKIYTLCKDKENKGCHKSITIDGVTYDNVTDACKKLGISRNTFYKKNR